MLLRSWIANRRNTRNREAELRILMALSLLPVDGEISGVSLKISAGLGSARFYPAAARLEVSDLISSRWEDEVDKRPPMCPRRRFYRLVPAAEREKLHKGRAW